MPQYLPSSEGGIRTDGEQPSLSAKGVPEDRVEMDGDGMGDTYRVDGVVGVLLPFIDDEKEDFKR